MADPTSNTNKNIEYATRHLWDRTPRNQILEAMPMLARLALSKKVTFSGGKTIRLLEIKDDATELMQWYSFNEQLATGKKTYLESPYFEMKLAQMPVTYNIEEMLLNIGGGSADTKILDISKLIVKQAQEGVRKALYKAMFGFGDTAALDYDSTDTGKLISSVRQALTHDAAYGHLTRATTATNKWWQAASIDGSFADQTTAYDASVYTFRRMVQQCRRYTIGAKPSDFLLLTGPSNFLKLKTEVEASKFITTTGPLIKYGFNSFTLDNVEVVEDYFLTDDYASGAATGSLSGYGASKWWFLLYMPSWEFRIWNQRNFKLTPFEWQGKTHLGYDQWLARIMLVSQLYCNRPNANAFFYNVS